MQRNLKWLLKLDKVYPTKDGKSSARELRYENLSYQPNIKSITFFIFKDGNVSVYGNNISDEFREACKKNPAIEIKFEENGLYRSFEFGKINDKQKLKNFLEFLDKQEPLYEIKENVFSILNLEVLKKVSELLAQDNIVAAKEIAKKEQAEGYDRFLWDVVNKLHMPEKDEAKIKELIELYEIFNAKNDHYKEANSRLVVLYGELNSKCPSANLFYHLERQLDAATKSEEQNLIDRLFHQLCGYPYSELKLKNVKGDGPTLIAFATEVRQNEQSKKIQAELEKENAALKEMQNKLKKENQELIEESNMLKRKAPDDEENKKFKKFGSGFF